MADNLDGSYAGAPIDGIDDWTVQFRAAIASPDSLPALSTVETEALAKGRQFRDVFATLKRKAVPWGTLSATCRLPTSWATRTRGVSARRS